MATSSLLKRQNFNVTPEEESQLQQLRDALGTASIKDALLRATRVVLTLNQEVQEGKTLGLSKEQAKTLLEKIETKTLLGLRDKAMLSLIIRTGLRRMDVIGATIGRVGERDGHTILTMR